MSSCFEWSAGPGIRKVCQRFIALCRQLKLFSQAIFAIDGSKFKAVNSQDRNFTVGKIDKRQEQIEHSIQRSRVIQSSHALNEARD